MTGIVVQPQQRTRSNRWLGFGAVAFGLLTALLVVRYVAQQTQDRTARGTASVPVVVAKQDIAPGTTLSAEMIELKLVAPDVAAHTAFAQTKQVAGQRARYAIPAGSQIVPSMLVQVGSADALSFVVPQGMRAVAVTTSNVIGGGNHIRPGDFVDVMAVFDASKLSGGSAAPGAGQALQGVFTVLQNIQVLAVADDVETAASAGPQARNGNAKARAAPDLSKNASVTLAVDPGQAQLLFLAETEGKIRLTLRAFGDKGQQPLAPVLEPLGAPTGNAGPPR